MSNPLANKTSNTLSFNSCRSSLYFLIKGKDTPKGTSKRHQHDVSLFRETEVLDYILVHQRCTSGQWARHSWHQAVTRHGRGHIYSSQLEFISRDLWQKSDTTDMESLLHSQVIIKCINSVRNENVFIRYIFQRVWESLTHWAGVNYFKDV